MADTGQDPPERVEGLRGDYQCKECGKWLHHDPETETPRPERCGWCAAAAELYPEDDERRGGDKPERRKLYKPAGPRWTWLVEDAEGRLWLAPARPRGWRDRTPYKGSGPDPDEEEQRRWVRRTLDGLGVPR